MRRSARDGWVGLIAFFALLAIGLYGLSAIPELLGLEEWP